MQFTCLQILQDLRDDEEPLVLAFSLDDEDSIDACIRLSLANAERISTSLAKAVAAIRMKQHRRAN